MRWLVALPALVLSAASSGAEALPPRVVDAVKAVTAFIEVAVGPEKSSGTGFLWKKEGNTGYVVTNAHVVGGEHVNSAPRVTVVFRSGTKEALALPATIVIANTYLDLALLRVEGKDVPSPNWRSAGTVLRQTQPVYAVGFPFGAKLSAGQTYPEATITAGIISALPQKDEKAGRIQIDGEVNPGNSGGPIVDSAGGLVGVTVAKQVGTRIAYAIPSAALAALTVSAYGSLVTEEIENKDDQVRFRLRLPLRTRPANPVTELSVSLLRAAYAELGNAPGGASTHHHLKLAGQEYVGEVTLHGTPGVEAEYLVRVGVALGFCDMGRVVARFAGGAKGAEPPPAGGPQAPPAVAKAEDQPGRNQAQPAAAKIGDPLPVETGQSLAGQPMEVEGARATPILAHSLSCMTWSVDGRFVYLLAGVGHLRKVRVPEFVEDRVLHIGRPCARREHLPDKEHALSNETSSQPARPTMARSREGLLVLIPGDDEVWLIHEETLELIRRIPIKAGLAITSAPSLSVAFVAQGANGLMRLDLKAGRVTDAFPVEALRQSRGPQARIHRESGALTEIDALCASPDGKYLFCFSNSIHRFKITQTGLEYEEAGPWLRKRAFGFCRLAVSPDAAYVALVGQAGNRAASDHPAAQGLGWEPLFVYAVTDLQMPVVKFDTAWAEADCLGFDGVAKRLYASDNYTQLASFSHLGQLLRKYKLSQEGADGKTLQILVHPSGNRLLLLTEANLFWVELTP